MAEAGWYPDPQDSQSLQYFDGQNWTGTRRPAAEVGYAEAGYAEAGYAEAGSSGADSEPTTQNPKWAATQPNWSSSPSSPSSDATRQHPQQSQWGQPQQGGWPGGPSQPPGAPPQWGGTPQKNRSKKLPVIIGALVVIAALVAVLAFVLFKGGSDSPSITYGGKAIANGDETLTKAESSLASVVSRRHGVKNENTRCYFVQPDQPDQGQKKSDVQSSLRCGPVLFVDGDTSNEYVAVPLSGTTSGTKATLTAADVAADVTPAKLDGGVKLVRPDGKSAQSGDGGLSVPTAPAADKDVLTTSTLDASVVPKAIAINSVMIGLTTRVKITAAGYITRYGTGDDARSAPAGQRLVAFRFVYGGGEDSDSRSSRATLNVDGKTMALPTDSAANQWIVAAVPTSSSAALQLTDGGLTQTLSLPDGKPGAGNAAVLLRQNKVVLLDNNVFTVPVRVTTASKTFTVKLTARAASARLSFWPAINQKVQPSSGTKAFLFVHVNYKEPGKSDSFGFDAALIRLRLPDGSIVAARNIDPDTSRVYNVFEVPADYTTGTVEITGSRRFSNEVDTIAVPHSVTVSIPAG